MRRVFLLVALFVLGCSQVGPEISAKPQPKSEPRIEPKPAASQSEQPKSPFISDLMAEDWSTVERAKNDLESSEAEGIAALIKLLDSEQVVPLTNTADLIYPGAKEFYGHGYIVDYELNRIAVRAGWVLEETTFENFGFSEGSIREADLLQAVISGKRDVPLEDVVPKKDEEQRKQAIAEARNRAKAWWEASKKDWSRLAALKSALKSGDVERQMNAVHWLRFGETPCGGVSTEVYDQEILPLVEELTSSRDRGLQEQAKLLVDGNGGQTLRNGTRGSRQ